MFLDIGWGHLQNDTRRAQQKPAKECVRYVLDTRVTHTPEKGYMFSRFMYLVIHGSIPMTCALIEY